MIRKTLIVLATVCALTACGGGGGGGTPPVGVKPTSTPGGQPSAVATFPPPSSRQGDVKSIATGSGATSMAYDPDDNAVFVGDGYAVVNAADGKTVALALDSAAIGAMAYSSQTHTLFFATPKTVYSTTIKGGAVATVASGLQNVRAVAVASTGAVYALDNDHIVALSGGAATSVTPPGSIGGPYYNGNPAMVYDSATGSLLVSDPTNDVVESVSTTGAISVFAGGCKALGGRSGTAGDCWRVPVTGSGGGANFGAPGALAYNSISGDLYMADAMNDQVWRITAAGVAAPVAGYGQPFNVDGNGLAAFLNTPSYLAFQSSGDAVEIMEYSNTGQQLIAAFSCAGTAPPAYTSPAVPTYISAPLASDALATAPDGGAWTSEVTGHAVDHISPSGTPTQIALASDITPGQRVAVDASGNAWYVAQRWSQHVLADAGVLRVTPQGAQNYIAASPQHQNVQWPVEMVSLTIGPDGNPWFTESETSLAGGSFGVVDAQSLAMTQFAVPQVPGAIAPGPNGTIAFSSRNAAGTGLVMNYASLNGQIANSFPITDYNDVAMQYDAAGGIDWFVDGTNMVASFSGSGAERDYSICAQCAPIDISAAPDGTMWVDEANGHAIDHISASGQATQYMLPIPWAFTNGISARSDGKVWVETLQGVIFLFDPAAYDAMNPPRPAQPMVRSRSAPGERWSVRR